MIPEEIRSEHVLLTTELSEILGRARKSAGLSPEDLSQKTGLPLSQVKFLETGKAHTVSLEQLIQVLQLLWPHMRPRDLGLSLQLTGGTTAVVRKLVAPGQVVEGFMSSVRSGGSRREQKQTLKDPWDHVAEIKDYLQAHPQGSRFAKIQEDLGFRRSKEAREGLLEILLRLSARLEENVWVLPERAPKRLSPEEKEDLELRVRTFVSKKHGIMTSRLVAKACQTTQDRARRVLQVLVEEGLLRSRNIKRSSFYYRVEV